MRTLKKRYGNHDGLPRPVYERLSTAAKKILTKRVDTKTDYFNKLVYVTDCGADNNIALFDEYGYLDRIFFFQNLEKEGGYDELENFVDYVNNRCKALEATTKNLVEINEIIKLFSPTTQKHILKLSNKDATEKEIKAFALKATISNESLHVRGYDGNSIFKIGLNENIKINTKIIKAIDKYFELIENFEEKFSDSLKELIEKEEIKIELALFPEQEKINVTVKGHEQAYSSIFYNEKFFEENQQKLINKLNYFAKVKLMKHDSNYIAWENEIPSLKKIPESHIIKYVSLLDYYNENVYCPDAFGIKSSYSGNQIKPAIINGKEVYYVDGKEVTKEEWFNEQTKQINVMSPFGETTLPKFLVKIIKDSNFVEFDETCDQESFDKILNWMKAQKAPFYIIRKAGRFCTTLINVTPEEFEKVYNEEKAIKNKDLSRFWINSFFDKERKTPKITSITFNISEQEKAIKEALIYVNGELCLLDQAIKIKSDSIEKSIEAAKNIMSNVDENNIPVYFKEKVGEELALKFRNQNGYIMFEGYGVSKNMISLHKIEEFLQRIIRVYNVKQNKQTVKNERSEILNNEINNQIIDAKFIIETDDQLKETKSTSLNKITEMVTSDGKEVAKRLVVMKMTTLIQNLLIQLISNSASSQKKQVAKKLEEFFSTEKGKALIQMASSAILSYVKTYIPEKYKEYVSLISDELRIQAETTTVLEISNIISEVVKNKFFEETLNSGEFVRVSLENTSVKSIPDTEAEIEHDNQEWQNPANSYIN